MQVLGDIIKLWTILLPLGSLQRISAILKPIFFDMVPRKNLWNRLEEIKVPLELRVAATRMYENVIAKFKNTEGWSKDINCNFIVKQGCPLFPTFFGIYIDKLEDHLEKACCVGPTLTIASIVINILLYVDDIVLMARSPHDLENQLRILKNFFLQYGYDY